MTSREVFFPPGSTSFCAVMVGYLGSKKIQLNKINKDDHSRILIVDANIDDQNFVLTFTTQTQNQNKLTLFVSLINY